MYLFKIQLYLAAVRFSDAKVVAVVTRPIARRLLRVLFHDLLLRSYLYHWVWSVITAHNLTPEKRDYNYSPHPLTPTSCLRNDIQLITLASLLVAGVCNAYLNTL